MADIPQVLATYDALVGVALGAGLTYGFGALNRCHQEAREDNTRWYEARFKAYAEFSRAVNSGVLWRVNENLTWEERRQVQEQLASLAADIRLVGSVEAIKEVEEILLGATKALREPNVGTSFDSLNAKLEDFEVAARKDLGYDMRSS